MIDRNNTRLYVGDYVKIFCWETFLGIDKISKILNTDGEEIAIIHFRYIDFERTYDELEKSNENEFLLWKLEQ